MAGISATEARSNLYRLIDETAESHQPVVIMGKRNKVVLVAEDPFRKPPPFEKLVGDLADAHSRRINILHRLVHQVLEGEKVVKVLRLWNHYE